MPESFSNGIIKARLKHCSDFQKTQKVWSETERKYLKDLRSSIAKDGSCGEAFDSIMAQINSSMVPASNSESEVKKTPPSGCFSDEFLSERYCKIAANVALLIAPAAVGLTLKLARGAEVGAGLAENTRALEAVESGASGQKLLPLRFFPEDEVWIPEPNGTMRFGKVLDVKEGKYVVKIEQNYGEVTQKYNLDNTYILGHLDSDSGLHPTNWRLSELIL
jgi:hypothetical protein